MSIQLSPSFAPMENNVPIASPPSLTPSEVVADVTVLISTRLAAIKTNSDVAAWMEAHHFVWAQLVRKGLYLAYYY